MKELEKLLKYHAGELQEEEKKVLDEKLKVQPELNQILSLIDDVNNTLKDEELKNFISTLGVTQNQFLDSETNKTVKKHNLKFTWQLLAAASIVIVLVSSTIVYYSNFGSNHNSIFNHFYKKYEASLLTRSNNTNNDELVIAIQLYDRGKYQDAITIFEKIIKKDATNTAAYFFAGASYIETKAYSKAITCMKFVIEQKDTAFAEHAKWYLALCYVKTNQLKEANQLLNNISKGNSVYHLMAADVLKRLN